MILDDNLASALATAAGMLTATLAAVCFYGVSPRQQWSPSRPSRPWSGRLGVVGMAALLSSWALLAWAQGVAVGGLVALSVFMTVQMLVPVLVVCWRAPTQQARNAQAGRRER